MVSCQNAIIDGSFGRKAMKSKRDPRVFLSDDAPLFHPKQDGLGRREFSEFLAKSISSIDAPNGFVLALNGSWGAGKTSTINFVTHFLEANQKLVVFRFNPWWFSQSDQLLAMFFKELRLVLKLHDKGKRLGNLGEKLEAFSKALAPLQFIPVVAGSIAPFKGVLEFAGDAVKAGAKQIEKDVQSQRKEIDDALRKAPAPILVIIDDLDRLMPEELRQVFQLIKAIANFPNTIYLLSFDRTVVTEALDGKGSDSRRGKSFVDKIVQAQFDLPAADKIALRTILFGRLDAIHKGTPASLWDKTYWGNVYHDGIDHFIRTPRDVNRFTNAVHLTYPVVRGAVNFTDFMAVESLRLFMPRVYDFIRDNVDLFAGPSDRNQFRSATDPTKERKEAIEAVLLAEVGDPAARKVVLDMLKRLFPKVNQAFGGSSYGAEWAKEWRKQGRVCSEETFETFFRFSVPPGAISNATMEVMLSLVSKPGQFEAALLRFAKRKGRGGQVSQLAEFLERLEEFTAKEIPDAQIKNVLRALYNVADWFPEDETRDFFSFGNRMRVLRLSRQLLKRIPDQQQRFELLKDLIATSKSIYAPVDQVLIDGQEQGKHGGKADSPEDQWEVSSVQLTELEKLALVRIQADAKDGSLVRNPSLKDILFAWNRLGDVATAQKFAQEFVADDQALVRLLERLMQSQRSFGAGDRVGKEKLVVHFEGVRILLGDPHAFKARAEKLLKLRPRPRWLTPRCLLALDAFLVSLKNPKSGSDWAE